MEISIVENLLYPHISKKSTVLELAPGHGRWSGFIARKAGRLFLVDLSPNCISFCRNRFNGFNNIVYFINDGRTLSPIKDSSIDFIWSFDSFVHMDQSVIGSYFAEFRRVLKRGGRATIHHPGRKHSSLWLWDCLRHFGNLGRVVYMLISMGRLRSHDGLRSNLSRELVASIARKNGLIVEMQFDSWGGDDQYNVRLFADCITILRRP